MKYWNGEVCPVTMRIAPLKVVLCLAGMVALGLSFSGLAYASTVTHHVAMSNFASRGDLAEPPSCRLPERELCQKSPREPACKLPERDLCGKGTEDPSCRLPERELCRADSVNNYHRRPHSGVRNYPVPCVVTPRDDDLCYSRAPRKD